LFYIIQNTFETKYLHGTNQTYFTRSDVIRYYGTECDFGV